ncbi:MAG: acetyl-CoA carboxylase biotin carboxylase subunit [Acidobacteria bacterium]|nr:MAG: acetyl-CoA carboxylase biotin carboxylase subunit [Acidobacteriota bacterium]PYQ23462.1 MAG: acetyl-CoA carboxylase biotin carboxylase subunit [Acidobacteriota bacterium]
MKKILVANRGEIAVRVIRACREMGIASVAVFSEADRASRHVRLADEAWPIGPAPAAESYLRIDRLIEAARRSGADGVHPGYGFLAENAGFARACEEEGLVFIGPRSETIALMGEKTSARRLAVEAGLSVVPGTLEPLEGDTAIQAEAARLGFPLMLKAAAGGGGKGLRLVDRAADLASAAQRARSEALSAFGDGRVYLEKALVRPRHVEIQVVADHHGHAVHLFERECSIQRRHQKVVEESPSPLLTPELRARMGELAVALVRRAGYVNAGTLEFLLDDTRRPYFLEMNTRLQVEHPVTELVTGVDLVKTQIRIARGERLPFVQGDLAQRGHAIECRVYAEDPETGFLPSPGRIVALRVPGGPGVRDDSGVEEGDDVPSHYDPLVSKLVAWGEDRPAAIARMRRAVREYKVLGIKTTLPFFERLLRHPDFVAGELDTGLVARLEGPASGDRERPWPVAVAAAAIRALEQRRSAAQGGGLERPARSAWRRAARAELIGDRD